LEASKPVTHGRFKTSRGVDGQSLAIILTFIDSLPAGKDAHSSDLIQMKLRQFSICQSFRSTGILLVAMLFFVSLGCESASDVPALGDGDSWDQVQQQAKTQTVRMAMWDGDPLINAYMRDYVTPKLFEEHGVRLELFGGQGSALVSKLMVDLEAGRQAGDIDVMWINGETFYQLRKLSALYGPFTDRLPNNQLIDWQNPFIAIDFQQQVEGFECPWGSVQQAVIYNSQRVPKPPQTIEELTTWITEHPGRFTFDNGFTGMTFLKSLLYHFGGGRDSFAGPFNEEKYLAASGKLWSWLRDVQPHLWREGKTFPESVSQMHQLLSNNEIDFSMSNNDGEVDNKVQQGILPESVQAYVPQFGTIRNSHYLGIPVNASNKAAALVLINFLISPETQFEKSKPAVWGDGTVLSTELLPDEWRSQFDSIEGRTRIATRDELQKLALMEPAPEIMIRIHEDFRREIIERGQ